MCTNIIWWQYLGFKCIVDMCGVVYSFLLAYN